MPKFNCLAAATIAAALSATAADAAVTIFDFEDSTVGAPYLPPLDSIVKTPVGTPWGVVVEDSDGKHLELPPTNIFNETGVYLGSSGGCADGIHSKLLCDNLLISFDIFLPNGGWVKNYYRFTEWVDAGVWTTINANIGCGYGCPIYVQAEGGGMLDNIVVQDKAIVVPEPGTWALMILGFGGVGAALRRRRLGSLA